MAALKKARAPGQRTAVVSGLGPSGVLAALELIDRGFHVTVVEKRPAYTRPIHLHVRASYLEDVRRLSPQLHARLRALATPIGRMERVRMAGTGSVPIFSQGWPPAHPGCSPDELAVRARLMAEPVAHVRLDAVEKSFYSYLSGLTGWQYGSHESRRLTVRRGFALDLAPSRSGRFRASIRPTDQDDPKAPGTEALGTPDLVVLSEGGKSSSVAHLGLDSVRFSYPKYFMSAHIDPSIGPRTRRVDTDARALLGAGDIPGCSVSLWAVGHGDPRQGTWIVLEVPPALREGSPAEALEYFVQGVALLLGKSTRDGVREVRALIQRTVKSGALLAGSRRRVGADPDGAAGGTPFAGTFKFEQQCLRHPAAGSNVVVLGDAAGMGHHALSSGLEMGACDLAPLRRLADALVQGEDPSLAVDRYARSVYRSRMTLLALGMREYYPDLHVDPLAMLHRAAAQAHARAGEAEGPRRAFETLLEEARDADRAAIRPSQESLPLRLLAPARRLAA